MSGHPEDAKKFPQLELAAYMGVEENGFLWKQQLVEVSAYESVRYKSFHCSFTKLEINLHVVNDWSKVNVHRNSTHNNIIISKQDSVIFTFMSS